MRWSVIVCTFNRAHSLAETLERLGRLAYPVDEHEILVVDNGSTDGTAAVIGAAAAGMRNLVPLREATPGLSHARNRGIAAARGQFVAFIDDDAWPEPDWLTALERGFLPEDVMCVGGRVTAVWPDNAPPAWLPERLAGFYSLVDYGARQTLHYPDYPAGTNIAFRKSVLNEMAGFSEKLGRVGACLLSMEETDICLRIEAAGYRVSYRDDALVRHVIQPDRLTREWLGERARWQGVSAAVIEAGRFSRWAILRKVCRYSVFIAAGSAGRMIFTVLGKQRPAYFCACQNTLCRAYIRQIFTRGRG